METTAQKSSIVRRTRCTSCRRMLRSSQQPTKAAVVAPPARQRRPWLTKLDKAASWNERAMLFWLDTAARYHTDPVRDVIVALKTVEGAASDGAGLPTLYVWEVAWQRVQDGIKWLFIVWDVSGHGVRFHDCADRAEAMDLYYMPTEQGIAAVRHSSGVYLRPKCRPA